MVTDLVIGDRKWSRVRGSNPPLQPYESRPLPYRGPARNWQARQDSNLR